MVDNPAWGDPQQDCTPCPVPVRVGPYPARPIAFVAWHIAAAAVVASSSLASTFLASSSFPAPAAANAEAPFVVDIQGAPAFSDAVLPIFEPWRFDVGVLPQLLHDVDAQLLPLAARLEPRAHLSAEPIYPEKRAGFRVVMIRSQLVIR